MPTSLRWPAHLPQVVPVDSKLVSEPNTIRSQPAGPAKVRRRFTAVPRKLTPDPRKFILSMAQGETLRWFHGTATSGGALSFMWLEPMALTQPLGDVEMRFLSEPELTAITTTLVRVRVEFEILP